MKTLYLECGMGAAGDMLLSALYELLPEKEDFLKTMNGLGLPGVHVEAVPTQTCGISGTRMRVTVDGREEGHDHHHHNHDHHHICETAQEPPHCCEHEHDSHGHDHDHGEGHSHHHASLPHITEVIAGLPLSEGVKKNALEVYSRVAGAESQVHGCPVDQIHFHEVGALDAVADITGVCLALSLLAPDRIAASPVRTGYGHVHCAHGILPVPAPATAILLEGIPTYAGDLEGELCTPTGAALLGQFVQSYGVRPAMTVRQVGYGIGGREFPAANCVRAFWGTDTAGANDIVSELTCNLDDMTGEAVAFACESLLEAGALDVFTVPASMKKGRPGVILTALCREEREAELAALILKHTTTNGVRICRKVRYILKPGTRTTSTAYGQIAVKTAEGYGVRREKPEYDAVAEAARKYDVPFGQVWTETVKKL